MHDSLFNPRFTYLSPVHFDELDPLQMLHNSRFAAHVERAVTAWYAANGMSGLTRGACAAPFVGRHPSSLGLREEVSPEAEGFRRGCRSPPRRR